MAEHYAHTYSQTATPQGLRDHLLTSHQGEYGESDPVHDAQDLVDIHRACHQRLLANEVLANENDHLSSDVWAPGGLQGLRDHLSDDHGFGADATAGWHDLLRAHREVHDEETRPAGLTELDHTVLLEHVLREHHYSPTLVPRDDADELRALHGRIHEEAPAIERTLRESMEELSRTAGVPIVPMKDYDHIFGRNPHEDDHGYGTVVLGEPNLTPGLEAARYHIGVIDSHIAGVSPVARRTLELQFQSLRLALNLLDKAVTAYVEQTARPMVIAPPTGPDISVGYQKEQWDRAGEQMREEGMESTPHHSARPRTVQVSDGGITDFGRNHHSLVAFENGVTIEVVQAFASPEVKSMVVRYGDGDHQTFVPGSLDATSSTAVLDAYKAHHEKFHPDCNISGPPDPPRPQHRPMG